MRQKRLWSRRRLVSACAGLTTVASAGCLRLTDDPTGTETTDREQPNPTDSATPAGDGGDSDTASATPRTDFDVELVPAWSGGTGRLTVADGDFFLAPQFTRVRRARPDGTQVFEAEFEDGYIASLSPKFRNALHADDSGVYVGARARDEVDTGGRLYAFDPGTGAERWMYEEPGDGLHDNVRATTVADDTVIYASQSDGGGDEQRPIVRALNAETGEQQWQVQLSEGFVTGIVASGDRLFVQQTFRVLVYRLSTQERLEERQQITGFGGFATDGDTLFLPGETVRALILPAGDERWEVSTGREVNTGVGVGSRGVFVGTESGYVLGYDRETGDPLWEARVDGVVEHPPIVEEGLVWIATERGSLSAFTEAGGNLVYEEEVASGFEFAVQDGILKDDERDTAYEIRRT